MKKFTILSIDPGLFPLYAGEVVVLPILSYLLFAIIGIPGTIVLMVIWLTGVLGTALNVKGHRERVEISETGISFFKSNKLSVELKWDEINRVGFQVAIAKRMGVYEGLPYLAFRLIDSSLSKLDLLASSKEFGLIQKKRDFDKYLAKEKLDLYVCGKNLKDKDEGLLALFSSKPGFEKTFPPLVKTNEQAEYDRIVKENFQK